MQSQNEPRLSFEKLTPSAARGPHKKVCAAPLDPTLLARLFGGIPSKMLKAFSTRVTAQLGAFIGRRLVYREACVVKRPVPLLGVCRDARKSNPLIWGWANIARGSMQISMTKPAWEVLTIAQMAAKCAPSSIGVRFLSGAVRKICTQGG